jgi:predicted transposase YbfD/YdcC
MGMIKPEALESVYREWVSPYIGSCLGKQVSVDGKMIRGASSMGDINLHMVSAWIQEDGITMGQVKTEEKSNEITAIPALLSSLDITGGTVSIDAIGCQKAIAKLIIAQQAHYVLAVKANQPTLLEEIREYFAWAQTDPIEKKFLQEHVEMEKGHGRITKWKVRTCDAGWFEDKESWSLLHTFICVERSCTRGDQTSRDKAYFISSLKETAAATFHRLVRNHWSIENHLHWSLDVSFHEDACLVHETNAAQNLSLLRKFALAAINTDSSRKASVNRKRKMAAIDNRFALSLLSCV